MHKGRLEAFSDAVLAIVMTIMVLEMKVPHEASFEALRPLAPVFASYVLSYLYLGIYWNNHHHMLQRATHVSGSVLWANSNLLFWLSLIPFATNWMGETGFAPVPVMIYGVLLLCCAIAYWILARCLISANGRDSLLAQRFAGGRKEKISILIYVIAAISSYWLPIVAGSLYLVVALIWLIPDRRFEPD